MRAITTKTIKRSKECSVWTVILKITEIFVCPFYFAMLCGLTALGLIWDLLCTFWEHGVISERDELKRKNDRFSNRIDFLFSGILGYFQILFS